MKTETKNPFETFLSVCRMQVTAGEMSSIPLMYIHGDDPEDCYAVYQEWDETNDPTVWDAKMKVSPAEVVDEDLSKPWIDVIELPAMKLKDMPETAEGKSVVARIKSLRERRDRFAKMRVGPAGSNPEKKHDDGLTPTPCLLLSGCYELGTEAFPIEANIAPERAENVAVLIPMGMGWNTAIVNLRKVLEDFEFMINCKLDTTVEGLELPNSSLSQV